MTLRQTSTSRFGWVAVFALATAIAQGGTQPVYDISLSNRFQYDSDATGTDADFRSYVSAYGYDLVEGHVDGRFSGALDLDTNGNDSIDRAYNESWPRVHEAAVDIHDYGVLSHLVLGRQYLPRVDYLHFDGLSLSLCEKDKVSYFAFGGRPVSYYTPYTQNAGEWLAGGGVRVQALPSTQIQVDGYGLNDGGEDLFASAVRLSQSLGSGFSDTVEARWVDDDFSDLSARLYYVQPSRYDVSTQVYWQAAQWGGESATRESRYFSEFGEFLRPAEENITLSLNANRYLGQHFTLSAGGARKYILDREQDGGENFTNIDSTRLNAGLSVADLPTPGLTLDLYGSYDHHPNESFYDLTAEIGYAFTPKFHASGGVTHGHYEFSDWLPFRDRFGLLVPDEAGGGQDSNLVFLEARYTLSARWRVVLRTEYEQVDRLEDSYMVSVRVDYHFRTPQAK